MSLHIAVTALFWIAIAVAVGVHAAGRDRSPFLWGFVTVLTGLLGVLIYCLVLLNDADAPDGEEVVRVCSACEAVHEGLPDYCPDCGEPLDDDDATTVGSVLRSGSQGYCSECKSRVPLDADRCSSCGAVL
jgi:RNA polymerase subunit RPABC4/transcription elongation factor Spt4